ncbi:MAG: hypothetical protein RL662_2374 [Bacteroidota bacterium]|jgi:hypothetical protein
MNKIIVNVKSEDRVTINPKELFQLLENLIKHHTDYQDQSQSEAFNQYHKGHANAAKFLLNSLKIDLKQVLTSNQAL